MPTHRSPHESIGATPLGRLLDFSLRARSADAAEVSMPLTQAYEQEQGVVHGGIITTLADTAAVYALLPELPDGKAMTSIELKLNFLRPVLVARGDLAARARVVQRGRRVAVCDVEVFQAGKMVSKGLFTYLIYDGA